MTRILDVRQQPKDKHDDQTTMSVLTINDQRFHNYALMMVFSRLSFVDKLNCERVCRRWNSLIKVMLKNEQLSLVDQSSLAGRRLRQICDGHQFDHNDFFADQLLLSAPFFDDLDRLEQTLAKVPNLQFLCLRLPLFYLKRTDYFQLITSSLPKLTCFFLELYNNDQPIDRRSIDDIQNVNYNSCCEISSTIDNHSSIKHFGLKMNKAFGFFTEPLKVIPEFLLKNLKRVERLHIDFDLFSYSFIEQFKPLQELIFRKVSSRNGVELVDMLIRAGHCQSLKKLHLEVISDTEAFIDNVNYISRKLNNHFMGLTSLTFQCKLGSCWDLLTQERYCLNDYFNQVILPSKFIHHERLKSLSLRLCRFDVASIKPMEMPLLKELTLDHVIISSDSFNHIARFCPNLKSLNLLTVRPNEDVRIHEFDMYYFMLSFCSIRTYERLFTNLSSLKRLKRFYFYNEMVDSEKICKLLCLAFRMPPTLTRLALDFGKSAVQARETMDMWIDSARRTPTTSFVFDSEWLSGVVSQDLIPANLSVVFK